MRAPHETQYLTDDPPDSDGRERMRCPVCGEAVEDCDYAHCARAARRRAERGEV